MTRVALSIAVCLLVVPNVNAQQNVTIQLKLDGRQFEGTPLSWTSSQVYMLMRDGQVHDFAPSEATDFRRLPQEFRSYPQSEMRRQLMAEFGHGFEVSGTGHYLVVHPAGLKDKWAKRFEELYRSFKHYFNVRGLRPQTPPFPFVAVVFRNQIDFMKYSAGQGTRVDQGVLGYYSPKTNRILLFDQSGNQNESQWQSNAKIIIHEASHQSAFNTGVHSRFASPPRWVAEGLGTMFEARGVWDSRRYSSQSDRINQGWFDAFKRSIPSRPKGSLAHLISSDRAFQTNPTAAYAQSWALTFYLVETQPKSYFRYLAKTGQRESFSEYRSADRLADFTSVFGKNLDMLDTRLVRYIKQLK